MDARRLRALLMVLGCLVAPMLITAQSSAAPVGQRAPDTVKTRAGTVLTGQLLSLDEWLVRMSTGTLSRSEVDWIALGAAEPPPPPIPEITAADLALLASGELLAGRIVSFDGSTLAFDDSGGRRTLSIGQVLMLTFCDAPCSVGAIGPPTASSLVGGSGLSPTPYGGTGFGTPPSPTFLPGVAGGVTIATTFGPSPMSGAAGASDTCHGDEQITFSPAEPRVGDELLVAVTSARPYAYPRLTGTEPPTFLRSRTGQLGFVSEWTVRPTWPGLQQYVFYVDSTIRCAEQQVEVRRALTTPTARPYNIFGDKDNNSNDDGDNGDDGDNDTVAPTVTRISFPTSTPLLVGPSPSDAGTMCSTFASQAQAQAYLRANPTDPLTIDRNHNGIACEGADGAGFISPPVDTTPVPRP